MGREPGTSRDERMLDSLELTSLLRIAKLSHCGLCGHNYSQLPDSDIKPALAKFSWCRRCKCKRRKDLIVVAGRSVAVVHRGGTCAASYLCCSWASHLLTSSSETFLRSFDSFTKIQKSGLKCSLFLCFPEACLFVCFLF